MTAKLNGADEAFHLQDLKLEIDIEDDQFVYNKFQVTDGVIEVLSIVPPGKIKYKEELGLPIIETKDSCDIGNLPQIFLPSITSHVVQRTIKTEEEKSTQSRKKNRIVESNNPTEKNKCLPCAKYFQSSFHLRRHLQSMKHSTDDINRNVIQRIQPLPAARLKCQICQKGFPSQQHLMQHILRHTATKDFRCHHCSAAFKVKADLVKHMIMHFDMMAKSTCKMCGKSFKSPVRLRRHAATHNNVRNYGCAHCSSKHKRKSDLKKHLAVHFEDLKKYTCTRCSKKLLALADWKSHMRTGSCGQKKGLKHK